MSWTVELGSQTDRKISRRSVETALGNADLLTHGYKQEWGWSCACDVEFPRGKILIVSGAGFSEHLAKDFSAKLASALRRLHYKIRVGKVES